MHSYPRSGGVDSGRGGPACLEGAAVNPDLEEVRQRLSGRTPHLLVDPPPEWRAAGVLVPLLRRPEGVALVLIRRGSEVSNHKGQIAFPGGAREPGDVDLQHTAVREAVEEIALDPRGLDFLGRLDDVWTPSGFVMSAFVAAVPLPQEFRPQAREVEEVLEVPLAEVLRQGVYREEIWKHDGVEHPVAFFDVEGLTIWGATGRLVARLLEVGFGWHNPGRPWTPGPLPR